MNPWHFGIRIGIAALMLQFSTIYYLSALYDVGEQFTTMTRGEQQFAALVLAVLGYFCVRWVEYQIRQFIIMFRSAA